MQTDLPARSFTQYTLMTQRPALIHKHKHTHSETSASAHPRKLCSPLADVVDKKIKTLPIEYACVTQRLAEMGLPDSQGPSVWSSSPLCGHVPVGEHVKQQLLVFLVCALAEAYWCSDAENVRISPRFVISRVNWWDEKYMKAGHFSQVFVGIYISKVIQRAVFHLYILFLGCFAWLTVHNNPYSSYIGPWCNPLVQPLSEKGHFIYSLLLRPPSFWKHFPLSSCPP